MNVLDFSQYIVCTEVACQFHFGMFCRLQFSVADCGACMWTRNEKRTFNACVQVVEYLLRNHASMTIVDSFSRTALHHATTDDVKSLLHSVRTHLDDTVFTCRAPGDDVISSRQ